MSACTVEVVKILGKYLNVPVGTVCYNTEKVLTTVLNKQNVEGFATIVMRLVAHSGVKMSQEQSLLCYQWLEHISMYANQAAANPGFAKSFLQDINRALQINTYLTGQSLTIADVAAYHVLYPLLIVSNIAFADRWRCFVIMFITLLSFCVITVSLSKHCTICNAAPKSDTDIYALKLPHEIKNITKLKSAYIYYPNPLSYPHYPVILYY